MKVKIKKTKWKPIKLPNKLAQAYAQRWLKEHQYDHIVGKEYA